MPIPDGPFNRLSSQVSMQSVNMDLLLSGYTRSCVNDHAEAKKSRKICTIFGSCLVKYQNTNSFTLFPNLLVLFGLALAGFYLDVQIFALCLERAVTVVSVGTGTQTGHRDSSV